MCPTANWDKTEQYRYIAPDKNLMAIGQGTYATVCKAVERREIRRVASIL